ncbi:MAG: PAS domain S-box protein [Geobacteraceae bacterium]|nr:PAS domain S-box protein [Geobacteraceae bacterium]
MTPEDNLLQKPQTGGIHVNADIIRLALIGLAYFATNKIALLFPDAERVLAAVWPAAGVGLAALLLSPRTSWSRVLAVIFMAGNIANLITGRPLLNSLCFMTANCLESYGSAWLITRWCGENVRFNKTREMSALVCAATLANAASATVSSTFAFMIGIGAFKTYWLTWWVADGLGLLIVTPVIVSWCLTGSIPKQFRFGQFIETVCFYGVMILCAFFIFHTDFGTLYIGLYPFLLFAVISWGALRLNVTTIASSTLILAIIAVTGENVSAGPLLWGGDTPQERLLIAQLFISILAATGMFLSASLTETRNAAKTIKDSEERFRALIEQAPEAIVVFDADLGKIVTANPAAERLFGCSQDELLIGGPQRFYTQSQPDGHAVEDSMAENNQRMLAGEIVKTERSIRTADGRDLICELHLVRLPSESGRLVRGSFLDITERRESEKKIEETAWRLELATASASLGVWDWNVKDNVMIWDDQMMALYGHTRQTFSGGIEAWQNCLHPDELEATWEDCQSALRGESDWNYEFRIIRPDGVVRWIKANGEVLWGQDGSPIRMLGINRDVTDSKETEKLLKEKEFLFRESQQAAMIGSYKCDFIAGKWESTEVLDTIFGIDADYDRSIQGWLRIVHPDDRDTMDRYLMEEVISNHKTFSKEYRIIRQNDGEILWLDGRGKAEFDNDGTILSLLGTIQDITERKKAENEKAKLEAQLHQAQKMESIGSLAGGVAHDFNNKLSVILGYAQLAQMVAGSGSNIHSHLQEICKAAESSADLTRQLLAFARQQTITPKILDLNKTVTGMFKMLNRLIGENIHLDWQTKSDLWPIKFDPSQIDQILANLCVNARDSISENGKISIETENSTIDESYITRYPDVLTGDYVKIALSDNGCGMDKDTIDRIFEPFFTTKEEGKGTGLGLATVFGIVKQNNGIINVYSEPGVGTTFTIYLPRYRGKFEEIEPERATIPTPRGLETILLVEDELAILNMAAMTLTRQGYTVLSANSSTEALRLAQEYAGRINLLITDLIMPEMNGKKLSHALQSLNPQLKSIFMSGYTADVISQHGVLEEGVNFIQKPFLLPDLAFKVRKALDCT